MGADINPAVLEKVLGPDYLGVEEGQVLMGRAEVGAPDTHNVRQLVLDLFVDAETAVGNQTGNPADGYVKVHIEAKFGPDIAQPNFDYKAGSATVVKECKNAPDNDCSRLSEPLLSYWNWVSGTENERRPARIAIALAPHFLAPEKKQLGVLDLTRPDRCILPAGGGEAECGRVTNNTDGPVQFSMYFTRNGNRETEPEPVNLAAEKFSRLKVPESIGKAIAANPGANYAMVVESGRASSTIPIVAAPPAGPKYAAYLDKGSFARSEKVAPVLTARADEEGVSARITVTRRSDGASGTMTAVALVNGTHKDISIKGLPSLGIVNNVQGIRAGDYDVKVEFMKDGVVAKTLIATFTITGGGGGGDRKDPPKGKRKKPGVGAQ